MLKGIFDEVDDHEEDEDLEGYEEETKASDDDENSFAEDEKPKSRRRSSFNDYEEDLNSDEKRRLMSVGMDLP